jgi:lipopolysaccharide/colanic/teichoic acid biosynthesis glycosyltransferase
LPVRGSPEEPESERQTAALLKNFTRVGRVMRALSLDTLPCIISVLRGDLSLVGPMAKSPQYMRFLCEKFPDYQETIGFKPGITGWSQAHFAYHGLDEANFLSDTVIAKMIEYDLYYIKNRNFRMDVSIVAWTLWIGLMRPEKQLS